MPLELVSAFTGRAAFKNQEWLAISLESQPFLVFFGEGAFDYFGGGGESKFA